MKRARNANCLSCPLVHDRHVLVPSVVPDNPQLIVVGESPGRDEAFTKLPFQGASGRLLRAALEERGLHPVNDVGYTNAALCWPFGAVDKDVQLEGATLACRGRLEYALKQWPDTPILALGRWAQRALGLEMQERWEREALTGKWAIATWHPAYVLRAPGMAIHLTRAIDKVLGSRLPPLEITAGQVNPPVLPEINADYGDITLDIETNGLKWYRDHIFMLGIATKRGDVWIFDGDRLQDQEFIAWLQAFVSQHYARIGGHNYKFDALFLNRQFGTPLAVGWDTLAMVNTLHEYWHKSLKELATYYFDADDYSSHLVKPFLSTIKKAKDRTYDRVPRPQMIEYLTRDLVYNRALRDILEQELRAKGRWDWPYLNHELPQINMLAQVERNGFAVDPARISVESVEMQKDIEALTEQLAEASKGVIQNPNSTKQVSEYLYKVQGYPVTVRTPKGAPSTNEEVLLTFADDAVVKVLLRHRRVTKLKSSYLDNIIGFVYTDSTGQPVVSASYNHSSVVTHRISATDPAVQTIPHTDREKDGDKDYGTRIRRCYTARPGHILITADGKGWEMTCAAAQSGDPYLLAKINAGVDVHGSLCDIAFGAGHWSRAMRTKEKNIYFGWQYCGSVPAFVAETGLPVETVQAVVDVLNENLQGVVTWQRKMFEQAKTGKIVIPFFNYTIHFELITDNLLKDLRKMAVNYPTQGVGWMIMSRAAYLSQSVLSDLGAKIVALVHDDYTIDVPVYHAYRAAQVMQRNVAGAGRDFNPKLLWQVEFKVGTNWGDLTELTLEQIKERYGE